MSYVGNTPFTAAFLTDTFSGNGSTVAFTMSVAPASTSSVIVAVTGVLQDPSTYSVSGTTLTFSAAPPTGTSNISVRYLGIPASGVTTTAYRTVTDTTATAGQTTFNIPSYTVGYINVFRNGALLAGSDYTATSGTTVVLNNAASAGDTITTESFYVSSVLNALANTGGTLSGQLTINSATGQKPLIAQVNGTEVFEVDSAGNVGIGTTSPGALLDAYKATQGAYSTFRAYGPAGQILWANGGASTSYLDSDTTIFRQSSASGNAERMRIDSSGNVGIGSSQLNGAFLTVSKSVNGDVGLSVLNTNTGASANARIDIGNANYGNSELTIAAYSDTFVGTLFGITAAKLKTIFDNSSTANTNGLLIGTSGANPLYFVTNASERARIDSSGNLLVGTTDAGATTGTGIKLLPAGDASGMPRINVVTSATTNAQNNGFSYYSTGAAAYRFYVGAGGTISATSATITALSDQRLKENIRDLDDGLASIMALKPRKFDWKEGKGEDKKDARGFIAQEFEAVFPDMIEHWIDPAPEGEEPYKGVNANLIPTLVKAIQEQQALIQQLQADVAALKGNS